MGIFHCPGGMIVARIRQAEGIGAAPELFQLPNHSLVCPLTDGNPALRHLLKKCAEGFLYFINILIAVQMVRIDVHHHRHGGLNLKEGAAELAGLCKKDSALSDAGGAAYGIQLAPDMDAGIHAAVHKKLGEHGCGGGLAVGTADAYGPGITRHKLAQEICPLHAWNAKSFRFHALRVFRRNGGCVHHQIRPVDMSGLVPHIHRGAGIPYVLHEIAVGAVRS